MNCMLKKSQLCFNLWHEKLTHDYGEGIALINNVIFKHINMLPKKNMLFFKKQYSEMCVLNESCFNMITIIVLRALVCLLCSS